MPEASHTFPHCTHTVTVRLPVLQGDWLAKHRGRKPAVALVIITR